MEVIKAPLRDVWPDPNNPRRDFGDIDALAETFAINPERPGEPLNPPVVVRHGHAARTGEPMYRLVDGERRFRAMRRLHDDCYEATFVLCDGLDEADRAAAMLATDDKARLTDEERSRGVQRMLVLDVPYEKVEKAARLPRGAAAKAKLGAARARLTAAEDFGFDMGSLPTGAATGSVLAWMVAEGDARLGGVAGDVARGERREWTRDLARRYLGQDAAMCADGYEGGDADGLVARALLEYLGLFDGEGGGGSE